MNKENKIIFKVGDEVMLSEEGKKNHQPIEKGECVKGVIYSLFKDGDYSVKWIDYWKDSKSSILQAHSSDELEKIPEREDENLSIASVDPIEGTSTDYFKKISESINSIKGYEEKQHLVDLVKGYRILPDEKEELIKEIQYSNLDIRSKLLLTNCVRFYL